MSGTDFGATGEPDITVRHDAWGKAQEAETDTAGSKQYCHFGGCGFL